MSRAERAVKLLTLLQNHPGMEAAALAQTCGVSGRTLSRDLDALSAAGFPVYFDHGYHLAAPALLPPITFTVDEALALRLAARATIPEGSPFATRSLTLATDRLQKALAAKPPEDQPEQLSLSLMIQDPRIEALVSTLTTAIGNRHTVKLTYLSTAPGGSRSRRANPYRMLSSPEGWMLLALCHDRRRILRIPVAHLQDVGVTRRRFRAVAPRRLERHLHRGPEGPSGFHRVRIAFRPPLAQALEEHPPVGALMWEDGPEGSVVFTMVTQRTKDLVPWLLACGDTVEVLEPADLRHEIHRITQTMSIRHASPTIPVDPVASSQGLSQPPSSSAPSAS